MADTPLIHVELQEETKKALFEQLQKLSFNPRRRFELSRKMAGEVKKFSAARARKQESLEGGKMEPRSTRRSRYRKSKDGNWRRKRRMFTALGKAGNMATYRDGEAVVVSWKKQGQTGGWANIAAGHFHGMDIPISRGIAQDSSAVAKTLGIKGKARNKKADRPATKRMADALLRHGYRQPIRAKNGKVKLRRVSSKHIQRVMNQRQAGLILRLLVHGDADKPKKTSWTVHIPARPFLGVDSQQSKDLLTGLAQTVLTELNAK